MYCKLFASLYQGTLRGKAHEILVFTNLLACCDQEGCVDKHFRSIADEVGLTVEEVKVAIQNLESPDPESRSQECDGARIVRLQIHRNWGWKVVNYLKYRAIRNEEDRREQNRRAQAVFRARHAENRPMSAKISQSKPQKAHTDTEGDVDISNLQYTYCPDSDVSKASPQGGSQSYHPDSRTALHWLNEKSGKHFRELDSNLKFISARLCEEGVDIEGVKLMIERQCKMWKGTNMAEYLRPETLFNKTKFDSYFSARELPVKAINQGNQNENRKSVSEQRNEGIGKSSAPSRSIDEIIAERNKIRDAEIARQLGTSGN
jgi:uncharacterized phage protein (TIGR02220 family)